MIDAPKIDAFNAAYLKTLKKADVPYQAHLDITYRCDLDCEHCYLDNKDSWPELRKDELIDLLDQLYTLGVPTLTWSGGEPFARPDFFDLLEHARAKGFVSIVKTHGGNVSAEMAERLVNLGVARVDVSLYSLDDELHDAVTRVPGSLKATLAGVKHMLAVGIRVRASTVTLPTNFHELPAIRRYAESIGCEYQSANFVHLEHNADKGLDALNMDEQTLLKALRQDFGRYVERDRTPRPLSPDSDPCGAGRSSVYITPDGAVWPCVAFPMPIGHLREASFEEIWRTSESRKALTEWTNKDRHDCLSCGGSSECFYCPGEAYKRTGDFRTAPDIFHWRTRVAMKAVESVTDHRFSSEDWASVPEGAPPSAPAPKKKFQFPIYQPGQAPKRRDS